MAGLTGKTIAATYHSILKVSTSDNLNFSDTLRDIVDGEDTVSCLKLATDKVQFTLGTDSGDDFKITDGSSTLLLVEGDTKDVTILDNLILDSDDCKIYFGDDQEIILDHDADIGLSISGSGSTTGLLINNSAGDGDPFLSFGLSGSQTWTMGIDDGDGQKFKIGTSAIGTGTVFTISSGSIGIGTSTPMAEASGTILHIHDSDDNPAILNLTGGAGTDNSSIGQIHFSDPDNMNDSFVMVNVDADGTNGGQLSFWTQPTGGGTIAERMRILESGNVGVGTNEPAKLFTVKKTVSSDYVAAFMNTGGTSNNYGMKILAGTDLTAGGGSDSDILWVALEDGGEDGISQILYDTDSPYAQFAATSDARLKNNIKDTDVKGLDVLNSLKWRQFDWDEAKVKAVNYGHRGHVDMWLIADEVEEVLPKNVSIDSNGYKQIGNSFLVKYNSKAIQELHATIQELSAKVTALENA